LRCKGQVFSNWLTWLCSKTSILLPFRGNICLWFRLITSLYLTINFCFFDDRVYRGRKMGSFRFGSSMFSSSRCSVLWKWIEIQVNRELQFSDTEIRKDVTIITLSPSWQELALSGPLTGTSWTSSRSGAFLSESNEADTRCGFAFVRLQDPLDLGLRWLLSLFAGNFRFSLALFRLWKYESKFFQSLVSYISTSKKLQNLLVLSEFLKLSQWPPSTHFSEPLDEAKLSNQGYIH